MKRTLTAAAALMVSSAGAVALAGTAAAASPELPADVPSANGAVESITHSDLNKVQKTVGNVVPVAQQKAAADPVGGLLGGNGPLNLVKGLPLVGGLVK